MTSHNAINGINLADKLAAALESEGLRRKIHAIYDKGQTEGLAILADVEGLEEDARERMAHQHAIHAVTTWIRAVNAARAFKPATATVVRDTLAHTYSPGIVDLAFTSLG